jgi:GNAT superfamily N-acetyltransferase
MNVEPMRAEHRGYVCSTWARGQRIGLRTRPAFRLVNRIVDASRVVVIASGPTVHAWACGDGDVLHYVYVPRELRGRGIARRLISQLFEGYPERVRVTHPWPFSSNRFQYVPHALLEAAA